MVNVRSSFFISYYSTKWNDVMDVKQEKSSSLSFHKRIRCRGKKFYRKNLMMKNERKKMIFLTTRKKKILTSSSSSWSSLCKFPSSSNLLQWLFIPFLSEDNDDDFLISLMPPTQERKEENDKITPYHITINEPGHFGSWFRCPRYTC